MYKNRIEHSLQSYQNLLNYRWHHTLFWLATQNKNNNGYDLYFAKPCPKSIWLPGKPRKKYLKRRENLLLYNFKKSSDNYTFCTLTFDHKKYNQKDCYSFLKSYIHKFLKRLKKRIKGLQYYWVIELHKDFYPHIHIIFNKFVHWKVIRAIWWVVSRSRITDIRKIPGTTAGKYISKYVNQTNKHSQSQFSALFKHVERLFGYSQGFFVKAEVIDDGQKWFLISLSTDIHLPDWFLSRPDPDTDFWYIPLKFSSSLLYSDLIPHITWYVDNNQIYDYFLEQTTLKEKKLLEKFWRIENKDPDNFEEIPF